MISRAYFQDELRFTPWETERAELMYNIAVEISKNEAVKLILKGGTGLMLCYRLARFSSDLDYDGTQRDFNIIQNIRKGSEKSGREIEGVSLKKDTDTVKRYMVHYKGWENKPLKIEISLRNGDAIDSNSYREINGIRVYKVENLILQKIDAFNKRYKARDIYDLAFMAHYYGEKTMSTS
jgi:predicted nucleotidyltransferase component of viral defense system